MEQLKPTQRTQRNHSKAFTISKCWRTLRTPEVTRFSINEEVTQTILEWFNSTNESSCVEVTHQVFVKCWKSKSGSFNRDLNSVTSHDAYSCYSKLEHLTTYLRIRPYDHVLHIVPFVGAFRRKLGEAGSWGGRLAFVEGEEFPLTVPLLRITLHLHRIHTRETIDGLLEGSHIGKVDGPIVTDYLDTLQLMHLQMDDTLAIRNTKEGSVSLVNGLIAQVSTS